MKRSTYRVILVSLSALFLSACGGGGGGGSAPPPPAPVTLQSIAVTPQAPNVPLNAVLQLTAQGTYSNNSTQNLYSSVTWSSSASAVAAVGASTGLVTPTAGATAGQTAIITATNGTLTATTTVTLAAALPTFTVAGVTDPLTSQQWGLLNTAQTGFADASGVANTGTLGTDINVATVYSTYGNTGAGVTVAVVDSGLEIAHEDLSANVVSGGSWDFVNNDTDPTSASTTGDHGTSVAGLIAMVKGNAKGGIGVAPNAHLKGFNFLAPSSPMLYADLFAALGGSTASPNSSDVSIFNQSFGTNNKVDTTINASLEAQYASGVSSLRGGKGALYVKSAGNGYTGFGTAICTQSVALGVSCQNANFDPSNTLPYNIVMAALNAKGLKSSYSTAGSALWASTPGGEHGWNASVAGANTAEHFDPAMVTTDQSTCAAGYSYTGVFTSSFDQGAAPNSACNYTNGMNGTSSAAPMMSGVIALILEANPALTWREVKDILARTAVQVNSAIAPVTITTGMTGASVGTPFVVEQGWITNAAGLNFHNWYGFGSVNAKAAVDMARSYASGSLGIFSNTGWVDGGMLNLAVPDNSATGVSVPLGVPRVGASGKVETVQIKVTTSSLAGAAACASATIGCSGDLAIELTSPSGTKSILKNIRDGLASNYLSNMVLASNAFYGENSTGTWTVKVIDGWYLGGTQTLTNVQIRVYGH